MIIVSLQTSCVPPPYRALYSFYELQGKSECIHAASARGSLHCLEWLLEHDIHQVLNVVDVENGWSALHRAIYHGQVANKGRNSNVKTCRFYSYLGGIVLCCFL